MKNKVLVALSGGVDSAVAAALAQEQGYNVTGIIMTIYDGPESSGSASRKHGCYGPGEEEDIKDAKAIANHLGFDLHIFDLKQEYRANVLETFKADYQSGRTPNPCVYCNQKIKLGALIDKAVDFGLDFDYVFTGHYARTSYHRDSNRNLLLRAKSHKKDQSYFLSRLTQHQLQILRFPLGDLSKEEVRHHAAGLRLPVSDKAESQNFIAGGYQQLFCHEEEFGPIKDEYGNILGTHKGISHFTVGQRQGLGLTTTEPVYVVRIEAEDNTVVVGSKSSLYHPRITVDKLNWISIAELNDCYEVDVRIRSGATLTPAKLIPATHQDSVTIEFEQPQMAPAPGQIAVFYDEEVVVGSGVITHS